ncbi:MAG: 4-hydroxy-tetrahydrodipicolinate reductase [Candidatus Kapaibacterium sp.]|jgi:4-hydroxy-tetrahydrodipicolinate reductase|nr:4-hydroxy-tetrahydrodipicolinate reductase [Candidatus Kapabacteria bacterium]
MQNNLKIALLGYGNMGKEIHRLSELQGIEVSEIFDEINLPEARNNYDFDVAVDFSVPPAVKDNVRIMSECGKDIVIGTTGWYKDTDIIKDYAIQNNTGIVWGSNFSVGMQIFFKIVALSAKLVNQAQEYDIFMHELHHNRKKDSPSGTAISLAEIIRTNVDRKKEILTETSNGEILKEQLHVSSTRGGEVPGTHTIYLDSLSDSIELTHRARNRSGFASGALTAAKLIKGKKGFFSFEELLNDMWKTA